MTRTVRPALEAAGRDTRNIFTSVHSRAAEIDPPDGPLAGVPLAVKDLIDHAGATTTAGSAFYRHDASVTAPALARLEEAGAVVIGRTNLHEFAYGFSSENAWFGPVRNPWDPTLSAGGSSGGSAAAVAAGIVPLALGTDTGGSVRVPAALCGVVGLKTTHGLVPLDGVFPLVPSFDTVGAIADSLDLVETATAVMAADGWPAESGPDPHRLVVPEEWIASAPLTDEVAKAFDGFLAQAAEAGYEIERRRLADLTASRLQPVLFGPEVARIHRVWREEGRPYGADVADRIDAALAVDPSSDDFAAAQRWRERITAVIDDVTSDGSMIVTPTVGGLDKKIGSDRIGEHHYRPVLSWFTAPVNPAGHPALTMPVGGAGRPPSIQFIGAKWSERRILTLARTLKDLGILAVPALPYG